MRRVRRVNASALALALVLLPACTEPRGATGPSGPTSTGTPATTDAAVVRRVDLQVRYVLEGISEEGPAVAILWDPRLVFVPSRRPGEEIEAGDVLGLSRIAPDLRRALATGARTSSIDASVLAELRSHEGRILAPIAGTLALENGRPASARTSSIRSNEPGSAPPRSGSCSKRSTWSRRSRRPRT